MRFIIEQNAERVSALLEATRKELEALREALNAQPARKAKNPNRSPPCEGPSARRPVVHCAALERREGRVTY